MLPSPIATEMPRCSLPLRPERAIARLGRPRAAMAPPAPTRRPKLVAFDLDATLWIPEMYELSGAPFRPDPKAPSSRVVDRAGEVVSLMGDSRAILKELAVDEAWKDVEVAYVSRTEYPEWADACLKLFRVSDAVTMHALGGQQEIYPGSKLTHFRRIHERTGIEYEDMLFFDNEMWNIKEVSRLGVTCVHTPRGMTQNAWRQGLQQFAANASK